MTDDITLRSPAPEGLRDWVQPLFDAFSEEFSEPQFLSEEAMLDASRLINAFDGERRIGSAGSIAYRLTVPGGEVGASGITAVGVNPDQRRRGILAHFGSRTWPPPAASASAGPARYSPPTCCSRRRSPRSATPCSSGHRADHPRGGCNSPT